jgi:hypothetical protein
MAKLFSMVITVVFGISFVGLGMVQANDALANSSPIMIAKGKAGDDHGKAGGDHGQAGMDHGKAEDHGKAGEDHGQAGEDHGQAGDDHGKAGDDHGKKKAAKKKAH